MKRFISLIFVAMIFLSMSITAFAGSIPEDFLHDDNAQIFFAEVVYYHPDKENPDIELSPVKVIKGDVKTGVKLTYYNPNPVGDFRVKVGEIYLFTYFNEDNPTDIFEVTSHITSTLKLKHVSGDMWERFEKYLNEGKYEEAEHARRDRKNEGYPVSGGEVSLIDLIGVPQNEAKTVSIHAQGEIFEVDVKAFYKAISDIVLTDIEDVSLAKKDGEGFALLEGMYISVNGLKGYAFVSDEGMVDKNGLHLSRLPIGAYLMKSADLAKLKAFTSSKDEEVSLPLIWIALGVALLLVVAFWVAFVIGYGVKKKKDMN